MERYRSFQPTWMLLIVIPVMFYLRYLGLYWSGNTAAVTIIWSMEASMLLLVLLFYGLYTTIDDDRITLAYGIGIIKIRIYLSQIAGTEIVRNKWYYGFGIRIIPNGMLYNAHGLDAVQLQLKNKKRIIRIGTQEPYRLKMEIDDRL